MLSQIDSDVKATDAGCSDISKIGIPEKTSLSGRETPPSTLRFYKSCGFTYSHRIPDFFTDNYPDPIIEEGVRLRDMIYLKKSVSGGDSMTV